MKYRLALFKACKLVFGFIFQTPERLATAHELAARLVPQTSPCTVAVV